MEITDFLLWLVTGGSVVAFSWLSEKWSWFQNLTSDKKRLVQFVGSAALGLGAYAVQTYVPAEVLKELIPWFGIIASTFSMVILNQVAHSNNPDRV